MGTRHRNDSRKNTGTTKPCEIDGSTEIGHPFVYKGSYVKYCMQTLKGNTNYNIGANYHPEELMTDPHDFNHNSNRAAATRAPRRLERHNDKRPATARIPQQQQSHRDTMETPTPRPAALDPPPPTVSSAQTGLGGRFYHGSLV
ncbi:hypothetical protein VE01_01536 [Pseudogymnoascus verrucosus]|uniref:Uncharacterized protein n=1 Tax=Pseudogymnoascus verrucosus TaxID=342668 RepID=A0A1B8GXD7_9PEZI|nr:uncharacterized protein VE01_01536 [Pseudogymnoascus verrucosus]OBU00471.1 hypothetical protein VE01_01536 [Pseudogymnoascus verrucosus]